MPDDQTLQVGDELLLGEDTRLTVLAIEGDSVVLGLAAPASAQIVLVGAPEEHPARTPGPRPAGHRPRLRTPRPGA